MRKHAEGALPSRRAKARRPTAKAGHGARLGGSAPAITTKEHHSLAAGPRTVASGGTILLEPRMAEMLRVLGAAYTKF